MRSLRISAALLIAPLLCADSLTEKRRVQLSYVTNGARLPVWSGGGLVVLENSGSVAPLLFVFDAQGRRVFDSTLAIPDSQKIEVNGFSRGPDGVVAAAGITWAAGGRATPFLALFSADGRLERVIRTAPFTPYHVSVAPDGTLWAQGLELVNMSEREPGVSKDGGILRHFDRTGTLLGSYLPRSSFADDVPLLTGRLISTGDGAGWYSRPHNRYTEIQNDGTRREFAVPALGSGEDVAGLAVTASNEVFIAIRRNAAVPRAFEIYRLVRASGQWAAIHLTGDLLTGRPGALYGAEGPDLVFGLPPSHRSTVRFYSVAP